MFTPLSLLPLSQSVTQRPISSTLLRLIHVRPRQRSLELRELRELRERRIPSIRAAAALGDPQVVAMVLAATAATCCSAHGGHRNDGEQLHT